MAEVRDARIGNAGREESSLGALSRDDLRGCSAPPGDELDDKNLEGGRDAILLEGLICSTICCTAASAN